MDRLVRSSMRPEVGSSNPPIIRRVVVLPQPDGPRREKNSPSSTSRSMWSTAIASPKRLTTSTRRTSTAGTVLRNSWSAGCRSRRGGDGRSQQERRGRPARPPACTGWADRRSPRMGCQRPGQPAEFATESPIPVRISSLWITPRRGVQPPASPTGTDLSVDRRAGLGYRRSGRQNDRHAMSPMESTSPCPP